MSVSLLLQNSYFLLEMYRICKESANLTLFMPPIEPWPPSRVQWRPPTSTRRPRPRHRTSPYRPLRDLRPLAPLVPVALPAVLPVELTKIQNRVSFVIETA